MARDYLKTYMTIEELDRRFKQDTQEPTIKSECTDTVVEREEEDAK